MTEIRDGASVWLPTGTAAQDSDFFSGNNPLTINRLAYEFLLEPIM